MVGTVTPATCAHREPCGCQHYSGCCLSCPFSECLFTGTQGRNSRRIANEGRDEEIRYRRAQDESVKDIAEAFGLRTRTVFRILAAAPK